MDGLHEQRERRVPVEISQNLIVEHYHSANVVANFLDFCYSFKAVIDHLVVSYCALKLLVVDGIV